MATASIERALVDAARRGELAPAQAGGIAIALLQDRRSTPERIRDELASAPRNGTHGVREGLMAFERGAWSQAEATLAAVVDKAPGLPSMVLNPLLRTLGGRVIGRPDGYVPSVGVAVQVHSRSYHSGRDETGVSRWERTVEADSRLTAAGIVVVGVAPSTLRDHPGRFLARLEAVLHTRRRMPLPAVVMELPDPQ